MKSIKFLDEKVLQSMSREKLIKYIKILEDLCESLIIAKDFEMRSNIAKYAFVLDWLELPQELREKKITEYVERAPGDFDEDDDPRMLAEEHIAREHFPIVFD